MLRKLSAALLAAALLAGPAFAADPARAANAMPATSAPAPVHAPAKPAGTVKMVKHVRRHVVRHKAGKAKLVRHFRSTKHRQHIAAHVAKPAKPGRVPAAGARS